MSRRTLALDDRLYDYLLANGTREPAAGAGLRAATAPMRNAGMQSSPEQGELLAFLVETLGARRAIEVGVFTGYSALRIAAALPADGLLIACDVSTEYTSVGRPYWEQAGVAARIDLRIAPAAETLASLIADGGAGGFDFAYVDADKTGYAGYVEQLLVLLRPGGVMAIDNVLWSGSVADPSDTSADTAALRTLNAALHDDPRLSIVMLPIGDGVTLARKR